jgi:hypothetical protein
VLIVDDVRLDPAAREVLIDGIPLDITSVEFSLLEALLRNAGHVVTREHLTQTVLGHKLGTFDRVIDVHVSNLRKKLSRVHAGERIPIRRPVRSEMTTRIHSLFLKIFLWFWATVIVTAISLVAAFAILSGNGVSQSHAILTETARQSGAMAIEEVELHGAPAASAYLGRLEDRIHLQACLFDISGNVII